MKSKRFDRAASVFREERPRKVEKARSVLRELLRENWPGEATRSLKADPWEPSDDDLAALVLEHDGSVRAISKEVGVCERSVFRKLKAWRERGDE